MSLSLALVLQQAVAPALLANGDRWLSWWPRQEAFSQGPHAEGRGSWGCSSLLAQGLSSGKVSASCEEQKRVLPATSQR